MVTRRIILVAALLLGVAVFVVLRVGRVIPNAPPVARRAADQPEKVDGQDSKSTTPAAENSASPLADQLNSPNRTIRHDLEVLNDLFITFQTNFPATGNPVGENAEITAALTGANPARFAFIPKNHPAINAAGELCDRWGTPFRFHQLSGRQMEIRSAGPDKKFGTADDVEFAPWPK